MSERSLSICIPTYNRREDLGQLLQSIQTSLAGCKQPQLIEVVISDNASDDGTREMVVEWQRRLPNIVYVCNESNIGYARNMNQAVDLASAPYCWLMGSDEKIIPQGLLAICEEIKTGADIILASPVTHGRQRHYLPESARFAVHSATDFAAYLSLCQEFSAAFAFISTIVVRKDFWNAAQCTEWELLHPYTHMLRICRQLAMGGGQLHYIDTPVVETGHNVNEWNGTILPHFELDAMTMAYVSDDIWQGDLSVAKNYAAIFRRQYSWLHVVKARVEADSCKWAKISGFLKFCMYPKSVISKMPMDFLLLKAYLACKKMV